MHRWAVDRRIVIVLIITAVLVIAVVNSVTWLIKIVYPIYHRQIIFKYAEDYGVDPYLITAIIRAESKFYHKAESSKGAKGLMQISPITGAWAARELGIEDYSPSILFEPDTNIRIGCWYLSVLGKEFNYNFKTVIAAYNGGSGNVNKWLKHSQYSNDGKNLDYIPFVETREYVRKVLHDYRVYVKIYN